MWRLLQFKLRFKLKWEGSSYIRRSSIAGLLQAYYGMKLMLWEAWYQDFMEEGPYQNSKRDQHLSYQPGISSVKTFGGWGPCCLHRFALAVFLGVSVCITCCWHLWWLSWAVTNSVAVDATVGSSCYCYGWWLELPWKVFPWVVAAAGAALNLWHHYVLSNTLIAFLPLKILLTFKTVLINLACRHTSGDDYWWAQQVTISWIGKHWWHEALDETSIGLGCLGMHFLAKEAWPFRWN